MSDEEVPLTLLEVLDNRQNEVIKQLDELNERIERILRENTAQTAIKSDQNFQNRAA